MVDMGEDADVPNVVGIGLEGDEAGGRNGRHFGRGLRALEGEL